MNINKMKSKESEQSVPHFIDHDAILHVLDFGGFKDLKKFMKPEECSGPYPQAVINKITEILKRALNNRVTEIKLLSKIPKKNKEDFRQITFGLNFNSEHVFGLVEKGPEANTPEAVSFRSFWGELSTLRRFKDGSICEAVYFEAKTMHDRRNIIAKIIEFIFIKKLDVSYRLFCTQLEDEIKLENVKTSYPMGTNEEVSLKVKTIYEQFASIIRNLEIPLLITSMQGASDVFSYSDPYPSIPSNYIAGKKLTESHGPAILLRCNSNLGMVPRFVAPIECVLNLSHSSKWPDDLEALRAFIIQFYFHFEEYLRTKHEIRSIVTKDYVDVFYEGLVFRIRLYQPKEVILLKKVVSPLGTVSYKDNKESVDIEHRLHYLPTLEGAVSGLHMQNSCYGPSTALIKKWIRSHLIDDFHLPDMAINLLNAHLFLKSETSLIYPQAAFCRFLHFIVNTNFNKHFVDVNFNDLLLKEQLLDITNKFKKNRAAYPSLFIVTPYDDLKSVFTLKKPTKPILARLKMLAEIALKTMDLFYTDVFRGPDLKELFTPNYEGYNALIEIKPLLNPRRYQNSLYEAKLPVEVPDFDKKTSKIPVVDFNPVEEYLKSLRKTYGKVALFFHDTYGGNVIGLLWIPNPTVKRDEYEEVQQPGVTLEDNKVICNTDKIIDHIFLLGKGLVKNIETF